MFLYSKSWLLQPCLGSMLKDRWRFVLKRVLALYSVAYNLNTRLKSLLAEQTLQFFKIKLFIKGQSGLKEHPDCSWTWTGTGSLTAPTSPTWAKPPKNHCCLPSASLAAQLGWTHRDKLRKKQCIPSCRRIIRKAKKKKNQTENGTLGSSFPFLSWESRLWSGPPVKQNLVLLNLPWIIPTFHNRAQWL